MNHKPFALMATLALAASAGVAALAVPAAADEPDGAAYVALGDSFAAGTGVPPYVDDTCRHSTTSAYPTLLAKWPAFRDQSDVTCSGATTAHIAAQLVAAEIGANTRTVTVTVGGNDVGWSATLAGCVAYPAGCSAGFAALAAKIPAVKDSVAGVVRAIAEDAPNAEIYVTGYPYLFGNFTGSCTVGTSPLGQPIVVDRTLATTVNAATLGLNAAIAGGVVKAEDRDATYVNVAALSLTHGLCGSGTDWINGASFGGGSILPQSLHPNAAGEQAYANRILLASWLN